VSAAQEPGEHRPPGDPAAVSDAAEQARRRLHEEIERVRIGVEEMLSEQDAAHEPGLRRELDALREEMRHYVKRRVRKSTKQLEQSMREMDERTRALERRLDGFEQDRRYSEWRIHTNTEMMLNGLLREIRSIADLLTR
jgi:chromosome segregation ATPase